MAGCVGPDEVAREPGKVTTSLALGSADLVGGMRDLGLFGLTIPEGRGGLGVTMEEEVNIVFELGRTSPAFRSYIGTRFKPLQLGSPTPKDVERSSRERKTTIKSESLPALGVDDQSLPGRARTGADSSTKCRLALAGMSVDKAIKYSVYAL